jgi:hypothetical protein
MGIPDSESVQNSASIGGIFIIFHGGAIFKKHHDFLSIYDSEAILGNGNTIFGITKEFCTA